MSIQNFYTDEGFDQNMDVSASTRKFQTSVIINQDAQKSGILSYLAEKPPQSVNSSLPEPTTLKPSRDEREY